MVAMALLQLQILAENYAHKRVNNTTLWISFVGEGDQGLGSRALGTGYWGLAAATDDFSDAEDYRCLPLFFAGDCQINYKADNQYR